MPASASVPAHTPFFRSVENSTYRLIHRPAAPAAAFWLPAEAGPGGSLWKDLRADSGRTAGRIWFSASGAGAGQQGVTADFDFAPADEEAAGLHAGICGEPVLHIRYEDSSPAYLSGLLQDSIELCEGIELPVERPLGVSIRAEKVALEYGTHHQNGLPRRYDEAEVESLSAFGFMFRKPEHIPRNDAHIRGICEHTGQFPAGGGIYAWLFGQSGNPELQIQPEPETLIHGAAELRIFQADRYADAADMVRY